jgi:hypothetical protein
MASPPRIRPSEQRSNKVTLRALFIVRAAKPTNADCQPSQPTGFYLAIATAPNCLFDPGADLDEFVLLDAGVGPKLREGQREGAPTY